MYIIHFRGTRKEYCNRLKAYRKALKEWKGTIAVPVPMEIFSIFKIVRSKLKEDDYKLIIQGEEPEEEDGE